MKLIRTAALIVSLLLGQVAAPQQEPIPVSLVQLLANPDRYNGKLVGVIGFLTLGEISKLYLHHEDYVHVIESNAVWIEPTNQMHADVQKLDLGYVYIVGVFHNRNLNRLPDGIGEIQLCRAWSRLEDPLSKRIHEALKH